MGKGNWRLEKDGIHAKKKPAEFSGLKVSSLAYAFTASKSSD